MARFARIVVPGLPHHVTQRGNRREPIFFESGDHDVYCDMLAEQTRRHGVEVLSLLPDAQPRPPCRRPQAVHRVQPTSWKISNGASADGLRGAGGGESLKPSPRNKGAHFEGGGTSGHGAHLTSPRISFVPEFLSRWQNASRPSRT